ncbi:TPA: glycosyltransferase, partial [Escherichia coli]|nr:glycosyltransferase [Escherichia coli]
LADLYQKNGHSITIISLKAPILVRPESEDVNIINLNINNALDFIKSIFTLRKIIKKTKPDVIHAHMFHAIIISRICRLITKMPKLISSAHNTIDGSKLRFFVYRITDFLSDITTNVSQDAVNSFIKSHAVNKNKIICVDNGIDTLKFKKLNLDKSYSNDKLTFLSIGSLTKQKDYPNLFYALSLFKKEYGSNFVQLIVGSGPLEQSLFQLSTQLGLQDNIIFLGIRHDIPELLSQCDLFILSSAWEGFGLVVAEAMACEALVIGTDCGGVKDVISEYGFIVPSHNYELLKSAIIDAINLTPEQKNFIQKQARAYIVDKYSLTKMANKYLELYKH